MKPDIKLDELLNSYLDGELDTRKRTEVDRLLAHDSKIAKRLIELEKCKTLVSALPDVEAPAEMLHNIRCSLERKTLLGDYPQHSAHLWHGAKHLMYRKVLTAAAMIALVALLGAVIFSILGPQSNTPTPVASDNWGAADSPTLADRRRATGGQKVPEFAGQLEFRSANFEFVVATIEQAIAKNFGKAIGSSSAEDEPAYGGEKSFSLVFDKDNFAGLLADLSIVWPRLGSARLFVPSGTQPAQNAGDLVVVNAVQPSQIAQIIGESKEATRLELAKNFETLNTTVELQTENQLLTTDEFSELLGIPKPLLTSGEERLKQNQPADEEGLSRYSHKTGTFDRARHQFTIVVLKSE